MTSQKNSHIEAGRQEENALQKKNIPPKYPQLIQNALTRLPYLIEKCLYLRPGIWRAMRPERQSALLVLLDGLVRHACLALDGGLVKMAGNAAMPLTIKQMAGMVNKPTRNVDRTLFDLRALGLLTSSTQIRRKGPYGLEVAPVLRAFTTKFWGMLGLLSQFIAAVKYASENSHIHIAWRFKRVSGHGRKTAASPKVDGALLEKERQRNNSLFLEFTACLERHGTGCLGGYASEDACALCRKMR